MIELLVFRRLGVLISRDEEHLLFRLLRLTRLDLEDLALIRVLRQEPHVFAVEEPDTAVVRVIPSGHSLHDRLAQLVVLHEGVTLRLQVGRRPRFLHDLCLAESLTGGLICTEVLSLDEEKQSNRKRR